MKSIQKGSNVVLESFEVGQPLPKKEWKKFRSYGEGSKVAGPYRILNPECISFGKYVSVQRDTYLLAMKDLSIMAQYIDEKYRGAVDLDQYYYEPYIEIGDGTMLGRNTLISATNRVIIGKNVLFSERIFVSDNTHHYENIDIPISRQPLSRDGFVEIGNDSWIGIGATILPNVRIGKHCVIGANSVVNSDIPDYSVAVGSPARVIRRYDSETQRWMKVSPDKH